MRNLFVFVAAATVLLTGCAAVDSAPSPSEKQRPAVVVGPTRDAPSPAAATSPTPTASPLTPEQATAAIDAAESAYAKAMFDSTNAARVAVGQPQLVWNTCAAEQAGTRVAAALAVQSLEIDPIDHTCTERRVGENMARNFGSATAMFQAWMDDVDFQQNVVRPEYTQSGVACIAYAKDQETVPATDPNEVGGYVCSEVFLRIIKY